MSRKNYARLLCSAAIIALAGAGQAWAENANFNIAPQPLDTALNAFSEQSAHPVLFKSDMALKKVSQGVTGAADSEVALNTLLQGTGLTWKRAGDTFVITDAADPQSGSAAGDGADAGTVAALVVTAQKKEENIQDVPIAISAFTEKSLQEQKIEGGFDLLKAIPNVTFSKNNFTSYNFSIRGIGTKAVSATTDPGVAVSFNNIALIQNRLFEQEYFDVERVEVLRGPQGTLYGRNATAGVINVISAKPNMTEFSGWLKGEVGNYHTKRLSAMVNVPLVEDKLAIRLAGALTDRQGYDYNSVTKHAVNGRDLWSGRITVQFNPTDRIRTNLIWERFNEDDNRSRTGKQLCHRDNGPADVGGVPTAYPGNEYFSAMTPALFSQGCKAGSLYDDAAFGTPNGLALPFVFGILSLGANCGQYPNGLPCNAQYPLGWTKPYGTPGAVDKTLLEVRDPYAGAEQSRDLREIASFRDPVYRAKADVLELGLDFDITEGLTLFSQTAYDKDTVYSFQDYNRFNTADIFTDTSSLYANLYPQLPSPYQNLAPGGEFCDPQLGCSKTMAGFDISTAKSEQFTQEIRLQSHFDGPLNFSVGANYTKFNVLVDYYVMYNLITAMAYMPPLNPLDNPSIQPFNRNECWITGDFGSPGGFASLDEPIDREDPAASCIYVDPNPVESINGEGHNYFRSKNPYKLKSWAGFGELYWQVRDTLKVTAGLRYTDDEKKFTVIPSQVLLSRFVLNYGEVSRGYPATGVINQHWGEWSGRLGVDWKPEISLTDQTMVYAFYSRGYKGGGANPPGIGYGGFFGSVITKFLPKSYGPTFKPEFVNAFEVGAKNTLLGGALTANVGAFYYDYKDYQVSEILDRVAANRNYDASVWGLELEALFAPSRNLRINGNLGYLDTKLANGQRQVDVMNRTQGSPDYIVVKPWVQFPSNCVAPTAVAAAWLGEALYAATPNLGGFQSLCLFAPGLSQSLADPTLGGIYDPANYPELNNGLGLYADLGGNELPNSPHWTANVGAQYSMDFANSWKATIRADGYWQSQSWARVYNAVNDKLHGWYNANLSLWLENEQGLKIELYAKNILDKSPITDAFINSDDTALTTNVFTLDPRLIGLSIKKDF